MSKQASSDKAPIATVKDCATSDLLASRGKEEATSGVFFFFGSLPVDIYCEIEAKKQNKRLYIQMHSLHNNNKRRLAEC